MLKNAYFKGFYEEMTDFFRSLFESALKTNPFLEFSVITGCLRISKESIFTGLNNLEIISILKDDNLWSFLLFTGYLKKVSKRQEGENIYVKMAIPMRRSLYLFLKKL